MKKFLFWGFYEKILTSLINHAPLIIVPLFYETSTYGVFIYSYSISVLISSLVVIIDDKVLKDKYLDKKDSYLLFLTSILRILIIIIASILFYLFSVIWGTYNSTQMIFKFLLFFAFSNLSYGYIIKFQSDLELKKLSKINIIIFLIIFILCLFISFNKLPIDYIIYAMILSVLLKFILFRSFSDRNLTTKNFYESKKNAAEVIKISFPFALAAVSSMVYMRMDTIMIDYFLTKKDVGIYAFSVQAITISTLILSPIQVIAFPALKNQFKLNKIEYEKKLLEFSSLGVLFFGLTSIFILALFIFFAIEFNNDYIESLPIFGILFFSALASSVSVLRSTHLTLKKRGKILLYTQLISLIINLILNIYLIPILGIKGAAFATLIAQFWGLLISNIFFNDLRFYLKLQLKSLNIKNSFNALK